MNNSTAKNAWVCCTPEHLPVVSSWFSRSIIVLIDPAIQFRLARHCCDFLLVQFLHIPVLVSCQSQRLLVVTTAAGIRLWDNHVFQVSRICLLVREADVLPGLPFPVANALQNRDSLQVAGSEQWPNDWGWLGRAMTILGLVVSAEDDPRRSYNVVDWDVGRTEKIVRQIDYLAVMDYGHHHGAVSHRPRWYHHCILHVRQTLAFPNAPTYTVLITTRLLSIVQG